MKIKRFFEYVQNNIEEKRIPFNNNEIKYMTDKSNFLIYGNSGFKIYYLNYREVVKLSNSEYRVVTDNVNCNTIQSLIRYTKNWFDINYTSFYNRISNSKFKQINDTYDDRLAWYYNNEVWAYQMDDRFIMDEELFKGLQTDEIDIFMSPMIDKIYGKKYSFILRDKYYFNELYKKLKDKDYTTI